jgi:DNA modification methylase
MRFTILTGDALEQLKTIHDGSVNTCVTSPPYYGLRDYGVDGQIGLEETPEQYISKLVAVFREVRRVLWDDGTLWVNIGDSYAGSGGAGNQFGQLEKDGFNAYKQKELPTQCKPKDLIGIPWMLAFALRADGWYLRQDIIWAKPNPMPESVKDRCTKSHEYIFLLSKSKQYYYDADAIKELSATDPHIPGNIKVDDSRNDADQMGKIWGEDGMRNKRDVWTVTTKPYTEAHFATFPQALIEPCILAGCPFDGTVIDPFTGSGTTGVTALQNGRNFIGIELNPKYVKMAEKRIRNEGIYQERINA